MLNFFNIFFIARGFAGLAVSRLLGLMGLTVHDAWRVNRLQARINGVAVGDSRDHVRQVMREPDASWNRREEFMSSQQMLGTTSPPEICGDSVPPRCT